MVQEIERLRGRITRMTSTYSEGNFEAVWSCEADRSEDGSLWKIAWDAFRRGFTLTYFARAGKLCLHLFSASSLQHTCRALHFWHIRS